MEYWTLTGLSLVVLVAVLFQTHRKEWYKSEWHRQEAGALSEVGLTTVLMLLWPIAFGALVGWKFVAANPVVLVGFVWTLVMLLWDMSSNYETNDKAKERSSATKVNANVIVGACWAVGSLLLVVNKQAKPSARGARVLLVSLVTCVAFVVPFMIEMDLRRPLARGIRTVQRGVLNWAIGLFVSGIAISWVDSS